MSYIKKLDLLLEAEDGTDRRDFLKRTGGAVLSTALPGGDMLGSCYENDLFNEHRIMASPKIHGRVTWVAEAGSYTVS